MAAAPPAPGLDALLAEADRQEQKRKQPAEQPVSTAAGAPAGLDALLSEADRQQQRLSQPSPAAAKPLPTTISEAARAAPPVLPPPSAAPPVSAVHTQRGDRRLGAAFVPADRVSAQAFASFEEAMVITIPAEAEAAEPTVVSVRGESAEGAAFGHTLIEVGANARAAVVLDHAGSATYADNVEIVVGDGASLTVVSLQDWDDDAVHVSRHYATVGRDARLQHTAVTLGGGVVRLAPSLRYAGPGGDAELLGAYFADAGQHLDQAGQPTPAGHLA